MSSFDRDVGRDPVAGHHGPSGALKAALDNPNTKKMEKISNLDECASALVKTSNISREDTPHARCRGGPPVGVQIRNEAALTALREGKRSGKIAFVIDCEGVSAVKFWQLGICAINLATGEIIDIGEISTVAADFMRQKDTSGSRVHQ